MKKQLTIAAAVLLTYGTIPVTAQTPDRGPKPEQPREGWVSRYVSESAATKWNERAAKLNNDLEAFFKPQEGDSKETIRRSSKDFYEILSENCKGTVGEAIGGMGELQPIIHTGLCGQYKANFATFLKRGKTKTFAPCSDLHKAYRELTSLRDKPHWWYIGQEGERLEKNLKQITETSIVTTREGSDKVIGKFNCPMKD